MKILEDIDIRKESRPFTDCLYTILTNKGLFDGPKYMLSGMTAMAFVYVAHERLIPPSTEMYTLAATSWEAVDRLGIYSEIYQGMKFNPTFPLYQKKAIERTKESINKGIAALVWAPGITDFGVIYGYDDEDEAFFYKDRFNEDEQILLYNNIGKAEASFWMIQIIGNKINKDIRDIYIESLESAIDYWELIYTPDKTRKEFGAGRKAHDFLIEALKNDDFHDRGACKIINYKIVAIEEICQYLIEVKKEFPEIENANFYYRELNKVYKQIRKIIPEIIYRNTKIDRKHMPKLIENLEEAKEIEEKAISELKCFLRELLNNRYIDIYDVKKFV